MKSIKNFDINIQSKSDILLKGLTDFFWDNKNIEIVLSIINGQSNISLRILDWFVTNYSKKNKIKYNIIDENNNNSLFVVHVEYKSQLKAYNKKLFDPFCRRSRIEFKYNNNKLIITTIGQLNFFRWAIKNQLISYVTNHIDLIDNDITQSRKKSSLLRELQYNLIDTSSDIDDVSNSDVNDSINNNPAPKSNNNIILSFAY